MFWSDEIEYQTVCKLPKSLLFIDIFFSIWATMYCFLVQKQTNKMPLLVLVSLQQKQKKTLNIISHYQKQQRLDVIPKRAKKVKIYYNRER